LHHAVALSAASGGTVHVVYAVHARAAGKREALEELRRFIAKILGGPLAARVKAYVVAGKPAAAVLALARSARADVIVLGTNASGSATKKWPGSTTRIVLLRFSRAVLLIPPRCVMPIAAWPAGSIVAAIGADRDRHAAIAAVARVAEAFGGWLSVVPATPAAARAASLRAGLILYPLPCAGRARILKDRGTASAFTRASRVPLLVIPTGRRSSAVPTEQERGARAAQPRIVSTGHAA